MQMQIRSEMKRPESQKFTAIKGAGACQSLVKIYRTKNGLSEKFEFSMPCCSILFTDSEYITLIDMPWVLRELEPVKVRKRASQMVE